MSLKRAHRRFALPALAISAAAAAALAAPAAQATTVPATSHLPRPATGKTLKIRYSHTWTWKSHHLRLCVKLHVKGTITYKIKITTTFHAAFTNWIDQVVHDPTLEVSAYSLNCTTRHKASRFSIRQHWTGFACSFNPSLEVGASAPAGVSVGISGWPTCGQRKQAMYATSYHGGEHHTQFNSGSPIGFGRYTDMQTGVGLLKPPPCYGVFASTVVHAHGNSDSFGAGNIHSTHKVCLNKLG